MRALQSAVRGALRGLLLLAGALLNVGRGLLGASASRGFTMKRSPSMLCVFALTGCATNPANFRPTMSADAARVGVEAQALINQLASVYEIKNYRSDVKESKPEDCLAQIPASYQSADTEPVKRLGIDGNGRLKIEAKGCVRFREVTAPEVQSYFDAGVALSDLYCDDYFRRIALHKQKRHFYRSTTNDVGTAASVGLGLASAGSIITGGVGAAFGLFDALYRNYDAAFIVEPDLGQLLNVVKTAQKNYLSDQVPPSSLLKATAAITGYAQICSYAGMDQALNKTLEKGNDALSIEENVASAQSLPDRMAANAEKKKADAMAAKLVSIKARLKAEEEIKTLSGK